MDEVILSKREKTNREVYFNKCEYDILMKMTEAGVCPIRVITGWKCHDVCESAANYQRCPYCIQEWLNRPYTFDD